MFSSNPPVYRLIWENSHFFDIIHASETFEGMLQYLYDNCIPLWDGINKSQYVSHTERSLTPEENALLTAFNR